MSEKRWSRKYRVMREETVGGSINFYAEERGFFGLWDPLGFVNKAGHRRFHFDTQSEVEAQLDELVAEIQAEKKAKQMRRVKSVKVVSR